MPPTTARPCHGIPVSTLTSIAILVILGVVGFSQTAVQLVSGILTIPNCLIDSAKAALETLGSAPSSPEYSEWTIYRQHQKRCGLPPMIPRHDFRCQNGTFVAKHEPMWDIDCYFSLRAIRDGIEYNLDLLPSYNITFNGTNLPTEEEGVRSILSAPFFLPRWRRGRSGNPVFSFPKRSLIHYAPPGMIYAHLPDRDNEMYKRHEPRFPEEYHGLPLVLSWIHMDEQKGYISLSPGSPPDLGTLKMNQTAFTTSLQYQCIDGEPRLTLMPKDGTMFFDLMSSPQVVNIDGLLQFPLEARGHDMTHTCTDANCRLVWRMGPRKDAPKQSKELHVVVDLIDPTLGQSPKFSWIFWKSAKSEERTQLKRVLEMASGNHERHEEAVVEWDREHDVL